MPPSDVLFQSQQRKHQQQQDLCGKSIKEAGNETRNTAVNMAVKKKLGP
jgi:hypothetical protein